MLHKTVLPTLKSSRHSAAEVFGTFLADQSRNKCVVPRLKTTWIVAPIHRQVLLARTTSGKRQARVARKIGKKNARVVSHIRLARPRVHLAQCASNVDLALLVLK